MEAESSKQKLDITPLITPEIEIENNRLVFKFRTDHILEQIFPVVEAFLPKNGGKLEFNISLDQNDDLLVQVQRGKGKTEELDWAGEDGEVLL